jgi:hypothetical protein
MKEKPNKRYDKEYYQKHTDQIKERKKEAYQKNKEAKKEAQKERYDRMKRKKQQQRKAKKQQIYDASSIRVLMSLQEYTELNADKRKLWADFCWTLKDTQEGVNSIIEIMKVRESADNLIRDF